MRVSIILIGLGLVLGLAANVQALDPDIKCSAAKVKEATKYASCLGKAESKAIKKGTDPSADIAKCDSKYSAKWQKAEAKAGTGVCPTEGDEAAIQAQVQQCVDDLVAPLSPPGCCAGSLNLCGQPFTKSDCDVFQSGSGVFSLGNLQCGAEGTCIPVATPGDCCVLSGPLCFAPVDASSCDLGGTFFANAVCMPDGTCQ